MHAEKRSLSDEVVASDELERAAGGDASVVVVLLVLATPEPLEPPPQAAVSRPAAANATTAMPVRRLRRARGSVVADQP